ncbi:unnamed protein product, partial [marine sediment metagenome]
IIRQSCWLITQKEKKETVERLDGLKSRRITTETQINEAPNMEDGDEVFVNFTDLESRRNWKHEEKKLHLELDIKRALENVRLSDREKLTFEKAMEGYESWEMGMNLSQSNIRNALWDARFKIRKYIDSPRQKFDPISIKKLKEDNPKLSLADLALQFNCHKHTIQKVLRD